MAGERARDEPDFRKIDQSKIGFRHLINLEGKNISEIAPIIPQSVVGQALSSKHNPRCG